MSGAGSSLTIAQQAEMVDALTMRCKMRDGRAAQETIISLTPEQAGELAALADRLRRIAPFENQIRRMVAQG
ncbi:hypothetical protein [Nitratireductor rhodophyticola]|uniref:hypothetical protein n=1 Tax=Nitratireductor rhodophyticola TaxID=2854036 RepID=UPI003BAC6C7F